MHGAVFIGISNDLTSSRNVLTLGFSRGSASMTSPSLPMMRTTRDILTQRAELGIEAELFR